MAPSSQELEPPANPARFSFTKNDDIEWAHAKDIKLWCPAAQNKHSTDPYAPKKGDGVGVADWRERMQSEDGKTFYRLRAEHECINAHARRMGLRQLFLRGKLKARIHLLGLRSLTT